MLPGFFRETGPIGFCMWGRGLKTLVDYRNRLTWLQRPKVVLSAIDLLEHQESWYNVVWVRGLKTSRADGIQVLVWFQKPMNQEPCSLRAGEDRLVSQLKQKEQICPSCAFLSYLGPQWMSWRPSLLMSQGECLFSMDFMRMSSGNTLTDTLRSNLLSDNQASFNTVRLTLEINLYTYAESLEVL